MRLLFHVFFASYGTLCIFGQFSVMFDVVPNVVDDVLLLLLGQILDRSIRSIGAAVIIRQS